MRRPFDPSACHDRYSTQSTATGDQGGQSVLVLLSERCATATLSGQRVFEGDAFDLSARFDTAPDLRVPRGHLRIVPGKVAGEPHLAHMLAELQDHELIYELHDRDLSILVDMIFATGGLLRDLVPVLREEVPKGQICGARPSTIRPRPAYKLTRDLARHSGTTTADALIDEHRPRSRWVRHSV